MSGGYRAALAAEALKARRSKMPLLTFIAMSAAGLIAALFMFILVNPARAQRLGLLNEKAHLSGLTADWAGLLGFLAQIVAVGDLLLFSFIATWVFGREFSDGTMRYLLALPIPRSTIVYAKFTVVIVWSAAMNIWLAGIVLILGWALGLPGASPHVVMHGLSGTAIAAVLMLLVTTPVALVACAGRELPRRAGKRGWGPDPGAGSGRARLGRHIPLVHPGCRRRARPRHPPRRTRYRHRGAHRAGRGLQHSHMVAKRTGGAVIGPAT